MTGPTRARQLTAARRLARAVQHRFADEEEIDAAAARAEARAAGITTIADVEDRSRVRLTGVISSVLIRPAHSVPLLEADLYDGTGVITLVWLGREEIVGIEPGTRLLVSGLATVRAHHRLMHNPRYDIIAVSREETP